MKRIAVFFIAWFAAGLWSVSAQQNTDGQYLNIYAVIQQADGLAEAGSLRLALAQYTEAQAQLQQLQRAFPDWNPQIVTFRLKYLAEKITALTATLPAPAVVATNASPAAPINAAPTSPAMPDAAAAERMALRAQLDSAQAENSVLLAKLKEALSVQPAPVDAGELAKAQAQVRSLMKENALLKTGVTGALTGPKNAVDTNALATNQLELQQARQQIIALQSAAQVGQLEKSALENRILQLQTNAASFYAAREADNAARIRDLTQERDDLLAKLGTANQRLYGTKKQDVAAQVDQLTDQVRTLRERLAVAESAPVPYTPEELALLKQSSPQLTRGEAQKKSVKELPAGSAGLIAEAQGFFTAGQYDRAEADYLKVLAQDPNNALVLGNLAAIEMQEGKLDSAEKHIKAAVAQDPNDAYNLTKLGCLKFRQAKYDEALDVLSRAAKLDPQNPETQNFLGLTLSSKGLRPEAENALRKAIQLNPNYADAQNNLAVIYINQEPPMVELARWHYQRALDAGMPRNLELEKVLAAKGTPSAAP